MFVVWNSAQAQTALPGFTVKELTKGKTQISWINPYPSCIQLAVQRSYDSITNFRTIFSLPIARIALQWFCRRTGNAGL